MAGAVFIESDDNAIQNTGEPGIPGVTITLTGTDAYGTTVSMTTTTGVTGNTASRICGPPTAAATP